MCIRDSYTSVAGNSVNISAADGSLDRMDIIYIDTDGVACVHTGDNLVLSDPLGNTIWQQYESPYPKTGCPTGVIIGLVYIIHGDTTILDAEIEDIAQYTEFYTVSPTSATDENIAAFDGTTGKLLKDSSKAMSDVHTRDHAIDGTDDHDGVGGATEDNFISFNASALPKDSGKASSDFTQDISSQTTSTDAPVGASDYLTQYDASASAIRKIKFDDAAKMTRTIFLTAAGGTPTTTYGAGGPTQLELETNDIMITSLDFAYDSSEYAMWQIALPDRWNGGTVAATFYWTSTDTSISKVRWEIAGRSYADDDALDQAPGAYQGVSDAHKAVAYDLNISAETAAITLAGTPVGGELVMIKVYRDHDHEDDTSPADALLLMIKLEFGVDEWSD